LDTRWILVKNLGTLNVIDQYTRFKNIDNVNVLDISDGYGRVYTTFALLVKLCFVFVALVNIQPKCMDIFYVGISHCTIYPTPYVFMFVISVEVPATIAPIINLLDTYHVPYFFSPEHM